MNRLIFSDLHLHEWSYGATTLENGFNSRLWQQREALWQIIDTCWNEDIKYVYFAGDFFHTPGSVSTQTLQVAQWFFEKLNNTGAKFRGLVGNHDMANKAGNIHALAHRQGIIVNPNALSSWTDDGLQVHGLGYTTYDESLKQFLELGEKYGGMLLMHQGVSGVPLSSGYVIDERLTPEMIPSNCKAFTGHYHFHKAVSSNLTVIGNLTAHNWNDIDQSKGFIIWDDETDEMEWRNTNAPEFITYDTDTSVENCFVKYTDEVKYSEIEDIRQKLISDGAITVEFPNIKTQARISGETFNEVFDIDKYIRGLTEEMEPRRIEVGQEIREKKYEV